MPKSVQKYLIASKQTETQIIHTHNKNKKKETKYTNTNKYITLHSSILNRNVLIILASITHHCATKQ